MERRRSGSTNKPTVATVTYNRKCCWRCKQRGHIILDHKGPPKKFCSRCGKDNVFTHDCHGKCSTGRSGCRLARLRINYRLRPHIQVWIHGCRLTALIDSGSETIPRSFTRRRLDYSERVRTRIRARLCSPETTSSSSTVSRPMSP